MSNVKYETMYIIDAALEDEARNQLISRFNSIITDGGGEIEKVDEWGKRRLAYTIDYKTEGYYVLLHYNAPADLPAELERNFLINENIIRYLIVHQDERAMAAAAKRRAAAPVQTPVQAAPAQAEPDAQAAQVAPAVQAEEEAAPAAQPEQAEDTATAVQEAAEETAAE